MFRKTSAIVTTWPFIGSLLGLLINDTWLKLAHPGIVSGKLSDFAGIAIVSFLLLTLLPNRRYIAYGLIIVAFSWWKSSFSQPAIDVINQHFSFTIGRTVDYTDLVALLVIPFCAVAISSRKANCLSEHPLRRVLAVPVLGLTALGLMATTLIPVRQDYQVRSPVGAADIDRESVAMIIAEVAKKNRLKCENCADVAKSGEYRGNGATLKYAFVGAKAVSFEVVALPDGMFASGRSRVADRLRNDLKSRLTTAYIELEYIETLAPKSGPSQ